VWSPCADAFFDRSMHRCGVQSSKDRVLNSWLGKDGLLLLLSRSGIVLFSLRIVGSQTSGNAFLALVNAWGPPVCIAGHIAVDFRRSQQKKKCPLGEMQSIWHKVRWLLLPLCYWCIFWFQFVLKLYCKMDPKFHVNHFLKQKISSRKWTVFIVSFVWCPETVYLCDQSLNEMRIV
jgi:hypothetical protein